MRVAKQKNDSNALLRRHLISNVTMGISGSRWKKVAPASVTEGDPSAQTLKCQTSCASWKNTQKDRHGNRQFSVDDRNLVEEVEQTLETCQNTEGTKRGFRKSPLYMLENYNFCYNQRDQRNTDTESTHSADILPTDLLRHGGTDDKKDFCTFRTLKKPQKQVILRCFYCSLKLTPNIVFMILSLSHYITFYTYSFYRVKYKSYKNENLNDIGTDIHRHKSQKAVLLNPECAFYLFASVHIDKLENRQQ